ncbi:MAG: hypothetical protein AABN95_14275 [Acidobacteriota bacterium]
MSELDEAWAIAMAEAEARARAEGRRDLSEYLALRNANDLSRKVGTDWLLTTFTKVAGEVNRAGASLQLKTEDGHRFKVGNATMVGPRLSLENGVRRLSVEVGWPRTPRDGFIRGGGLACANLKHLGRKSVSDQLRLILDPAGTPQWIVEEDDEGFREVHEADVRRHVSILLNQGQLKQSPQSSRR